MYSRLPAGTAMPSPTFDPTGSPDGGDVLPRRDLVAMLPYLNRRSVGRWSNWGRVGQSDRNFSLPPAPADKR